MNKIKNKLLDRLMDNVSDILPEGLSGLQQDIKAQLQQAFTKVLNECHIVTQEEFSSYVKALEQAQERINALEARINSLKL
jgi:BMFP domain-containing protein YqiC